MIFYTKGEFIQALKDYNKLNEMAVATFSLLNKKKYLRFNKVSSPLNYEIVGYKKDEPIRSLKGHGYISEVDKLSLHEELDNEIIILETKYKDIKDKIESIDDELNSLNDLLQSILIDKYINGLSYYEITINYQSNFSEKIYPMYIKRYIDKELEKEFK